MLMTVLGNLGIALSEIDESAPERFSIEEAELAARRAAELSSQMLVYAGQGQGEMRVVALNQLIHNISGMLQINVSRNAILESHFSTENPQTLCDSAQMRQVVMNLVSNAAEAVGDRPGIIRVATGVSRCTRDELAKTVAGAALQAGEYAWFEVSDTGEGMDPETLGKVFDPFFTTRFTGRGLGLSTVLGIIRGHKGTIRVESAKGKGSTFRVLLPLAWESGEANAQSDDWRFWKGKGMILLVDDEEEVCRLCRRMLEKAGFEVITARDGHDAIELFKRRREDIVCVVLDLVMPRMDGEEALRGIRRVQKDIPVILSSGCNIDDIQSRFRPSELNGMVHKPYQYQELVTELRRVLGPCCAADR
jgi:CheY-like chemotaxis protein